MQIRFRTPVRLVSHYQGRQGVNTLVPIHKVFMKGLYSGVYRARYDGGYRTGRVCVGEVVGIA